MITFFPWIRALIPLPRALAVFPLPGPQITCIVLSFIIMHLILPSGHLPYVCLEHQFTTHTLAQYKK